MSPEPSLACSVLAPQARLSLSSQGGLGLGSGSLPSLWSLHSNTAVSCVIHDLDLVICDVPSHLFVTSSVVLSASTGFRVQVLCLLM